MTTIIRQAALLAAKDNRIFFKDKFAVAFSFLFPFVFIIGFSLALRGQGPTDEPLELTVVTLEADGISSQVIGAPVGEGDFRIRVLDYDEALAAVADGDIEGFVTFPADFTEKIMSGAPTTLDVVVTGDSPGAEAALRGFAESIAAEFTETHVVVSAIRRLLGSGIAGSGSFDFGSEAILSDRSGVIDFQVETVGDIEPFNASNFTLPGYLTMFVFFAAAMSAEAIARERRSHTLERLMSNGTRRESIIFGKFAGAATVGLMQITLFWSIGVVAFGIDVGVSPLAVVLISLLMVLASAAFGVLLASFVGDVRAASTAGVVASLVLAPLGGCWWPLFITPEWMQSLAKITPHGWANTGFNKLMLFGAEFGDVTQELAALAAFALIFLVVAVWRFRTSDV